MFTVLQEVPGPETKGLHEDMLSDPGGVDSSFIQKCLNILKRLLSGYSKALARYFELGLQIEGPGHKVPTFTLHMVWEELGGLWNLDSSAWLDWRRFCAFLCSQMSSISFEVSWIGFMMA